MKEKLESVKAALELHHHRCLNDGDWWCKDPEGNFIEIPNMGAEYADSSTYEDTVKALTTLKSLQADIASEDKGEVSDGYHTFNELYEHRHALFSAFVKTNKDICWKALLHDDGTMFDDWFIAGANLPDGVVTYHIPLRLWDLFECEQLVMAPEWDGHTSDDVVDRLKSVLGKDDIASEEMVEKVAIDIWAKDCGLQGDEGYICSIWVNDVFERTKDHYRALAKAAIKTILGN